MKFRWIMLLIVIGFISGSSIHGQDATDLEQKLERINLPDGYDIHVYVENIEDARSMCLSPNGILYVGTRNKGNVYAVVDDDGDYRADEVTLIGSKMFMPNGVAWRDGDLYVAEVNRVLRYPNLDNRLNDIPKPVVVYDDYPDETHHGWKYISFGPDGWLYIPVGAPCNICEREEEIYSTITRLNVDTREVEILHQGIRNTVGFNWHPETKELWFTDNGGDWLGDNMPACELNYAPGKHMHFGYPYCHQGDFPDPELGSEGVCEKYTPPAQKLGPHVAPLGMEFMRGKLFGDDMRNDVIIAEHGSWNRSVPIGYRLTHVPLDGNEATGYKVFADGWLDESTEEVFGRPVDLEYLPDGSLLVSDDYAGAIYRIHKAD